jgi:hypothetical protein
VNAIFYAATVRSTWGLKECKRTTYFYDFFNVGIRKNAQNKYADKYRVSSRRAFWYLFPWRASSMTPHRNVVPSMVPSMISTSGVVEVADGDGICSVCDANSSRSSEGVLLTSSLAWTECLVG